VGVDAVAKILHTWTEVSVEFLWGGIVGCQNTDVHPVANLLGAKSLKVLAYSSVGLPKVVGIVQHFFIKSKEGFVWEKNCCLIDPADSSKEC